ncbi:MULTISPECIES: LacI family DNA-binding transcriptional regulator [unclassified Microbacterium]|uniref:LacI family DNA-binding transcriptional regulator n=1 Tax=unclassified Microbacterium TaxID=2609290 RepID=UPI000EA9F59D|nr:MULTISPECIES: LacI family DNA-binding transcriptional regulator [unclassified Microbacterium]MBT2483662.1 LacI family DNA-binding transcriptional regulator [Microbacterium sp. ISL-108]RKN66664.1 LacI family transcriptional regulator [Microbacterium sp. CGR2]
MTAMPLPRATMKDVAALAGVSPKTVSNVVTGTVAVREETRAKVQEAMAHLDFVPNLSARGLRKGRSGIIAVALPDLATAFSAELVHRIVEAAHERGLAVQVEETASSPQRESELVARARAHLVDGLILNPIRLEDSVLKYSNRLPPLVVIGEVEQHRADHVRIDSRAAAADATRHVLSRGATRIAVVGADSDPSVATATSRLRLEGVHDALREAGISRDPALEINRLPWSMAGGAEAMRVLLERRVAFDAIVAFTDSLALGALHELHDHDIRVPDDVIITGFDDVEFSKFTSPSLTSVAFDRHEFAEAALTLLESRMDDRGLRPRSVTLSHHLLERSSTAGRPRGYRP